MTSYYHFNLKKYIKKKSVPNALTKEQRQKAVARGVEERHCALTLFTELPNARNRYGLRDRAFTSATEAARACRREARL